jgi:hypothetical protein
MSEGRRGSVRERSGHEGDRSGSGRERSGRDSKDSGRSRGGKREYQARSPDQWKKREERGGDWDQMFIDGIKAFKVKDGSNCIRIIEPTWDEPEHFGLDIWVHYGIGPDRNTYLCPSKMKNEPCPICEERAKAARSGDEDYSKELEARKRVLVYLIDRNLEKEGVLVWAMPKSFDNDLIAISQDKRTGEILQIDDPVDGYDVDFEKSGTKDRTRYTGIQVARRSSELGNDDWRDAAFDQPLPKILNFYSYEHLAAAFGGQAAKKDKDEDEEKPRHRERTSSASKSREPEYTFEAIHEMTFDEMSDLIEEQNLEIKPEDSDSDEDLADWICEEMKLEAAPKGRTPKKKEDDDDDSPAGKMRGMRESRNRR